MRVRYELQPVGNSVLVKAIVEGSNFAFEGVSVVNKQTTFWKARARALYEAIELAEACGYGGAVAPLRQWLERRTNGSNAPATPTPASAPATVPATAPAGTYTPTQPAARNYVQQAPQQEAEDDPFAELFS